MFEPSVLLDLPRKVAETGIAVEKDGHRYSIYDVDISYPFVIMTICLNGSARALYDMREITFHKNDLGLILPGHIMRPLECSEDYRYARLAISKELVEELRSQLFSHDYAKYNYAPVCTLTDIQVQRLLVILDQLALIASHSEMELQHRNHILLAQMAVGYEYLNYYRREQDSKYSSDRKSEVFSRFSDLVVTHYREERDIQFYAEQLEVHPKYLNQLIRQATRGITPHEWIDRYVVTQAKRLIRANPSWTLKQVAYNVGFAEPSAFYRYFKRVTGITAKEYKNQ